MKLDAWHSAGNPAPEVCRFRWPEGKSSILDELWIGIEPQIDTDRFSAVDREVCVEMQVGGAERRNDLRLTLTEANLWDMLLALYQDDKTGITLMAANIAVDARETDETLLDALKLHYKEEAERAARQA